MRESWQLYEDQYFSQKDIPKTTYMRSIRSSGVENCLFLRRLGCMGIDQQERKKLQIPGVCPGGGGMVIGQIEPYNTVDLV